MNAAPFRRGLVLGKFLPVHDGHLHLVRFARTFVHELTVVVEAIVDEPVPQAVRVAWLRALVPDVRVVALPGHHPQAPHEHPHFWDHWRAVLLDALGAPPDAVFASEDYGAPLAEALGSAFVPVDPARVGVDVSGTRVRADPLGHFDRLPPPVRAWYTLRVAVVGPESTGKSTLVRALGARFGAVTVPEYARTYLERHPRAAAEDITARDLELIAHGQVAAEDSLAYTSRGLLVCDTDALTTCVWSEHLLGSVPPSLAGLAEGRRYDLTLLLAPDVPWVRDGVRYVPHAGERFFARLRAALTAAGRVPVVLAGDFARRNGEAIQAVEALLRKRIGAHT
jgi:HTH-type transcriptional repressor of NAD biosynthesis genes